MSNTDITDLYYTKSHEWLRVENGIATVGISDYAQSQLGDLVFVDLPSVGQNCQVGQELAVVESVKTAADVYSPASGEVVAVNEDLMNHPGWVNEEPYGKGWLFKIKLSAASDPSWLSAEDYSAQL